jgi:cation diffusion facilitator family transporter
LKYESIIISKLGLDLTKRLQRAELAKGGAVAEKSFAISVLVGIVEVFVGIFSLSLALVADGVQSFADAVVSLIVWIGLRLSKKAPDGKFHFGYYRVETFSSVVAAFFMAVLGGIILYESYQKLLNPVEIVNAEIALAVAILASVIALSLLIFKTRGAKKYSSLALKADAFNSIKDVLTSVVASLGIVFNKYFHIAQTDSVAGIVIALFIFTVAYSVIKEASLVLMDACQCGEILSDIENIAKNVEHVREVHNIRMRKLGPYLIGDMHVVVDGDMSVREADQIATQIEERVKHEFDDVAEIKVRIEPREPTSKK